MKPNNRPYENTFTNRCAQFEKDQKPMNAAAPASKTKIPVTSKVATEDEIDFTGKLKAAHDAVLATYKPWRQAEIAKMELTGDTDNLHYEEFLIAWLKAVGEAPSMALYNRQRGA